MGWLTLAIAIAVPLRSEAQSGSALVVSEVGPYTTLSDAVSAAKAGDSILVRSGTYYGSVVIDRPLTIVGTGRPIIDGEGSGHVIEALAAVTIRGLDIRASGSRVDTEDAGIMVQGAAAHIEDNDIRDVLYGVYLKEAPGSNVRDNTIHGKPLSLSRRGDGIRLWESSDSRVSGNHIVGARDLVVYFSDRLEVRDNIVTDGRYGLHYMYSDDNVISGNRFERNDVGGFFMYSRGLTLESNVFAESRGATGIGIGLKDADEIKVRDNLIIANAVGVHLDNSPSDVNTPNWFEKNLLILNDTGVRMLPSVQRNQFAGNEFRRNGRPVRVPGGAVDAQATLNAWAGNYWSDYAGFDADSDARGDTPYIYAKLADELLSRHPKLAAFEGSPALTLLDVLSRFFPLLEPQPIVIDSAPQLEGRLEARWALQPSAEAAAPRASRASTGWAALLILAVGAVAVGGRTLGRSH